MRTQIHTGSDSSHVTVYSLAGRMIATVDGIVTRGDKVRLGLIAQNGASIANWVGVWGAGATADVLLPFAADDVIGAVDHQFVD